MSTGAGFTVATLWINNYGFNAGNWRVDQHPRALADINGDGRADIVGFGNDGVYLSLSTGTSFTPSALVLNSFGFNAGNWRVDQHPRVLADVNGDGRADIVGFGDNGVLVAVSNGTSFCPTYFVG